MVERVWGNGDIEVRGLDAGKSGYLAGYVTKKMTSKEDARLLGRHPEFSRQSNGGRNKTGGIGVPGLSRVVEAITGFCDPSELVDVPTHLLLERKQLVLGRYLRKKLRVALNLDEKTPDAVLQEIWETTMLPVLRFTKKNEDGIVSLAEAFTALNTPYAEKLAAQVKHNGRI